MGSVKQPSLSGELSEWLRPGQGGGREGWGLQGDQEALPMTWRQLFMLGAARVQTGDSGPWGEGSSPVSTSEAPSPEGEEADCAGRGHTPLYPLPGLGCIVLAAAQSVRACFRSAVGCSRCPPRPHELTHLHEAVCVREARQHHLPVRLGCARGRLGFGLSGTGGRHFSGWRGSSRENASASATCAHCACAEAVPAGGGLGSLSWDRISQRTRPPPQPPLTAPPRRLTFFI